MTESPSLGRPVVRLGLRRMRQLLRALDDPDRAIPRILHVAGTNGKGSVAAMLAAILRASGYRVGLYVSPHWRREQDALRLGDAQGETEIDAETFANLAERVRSAAQVAARRCGEEPTRFECLTALMYLWCAESGVEVLVQEAGLGGRLDATNAVTRTDLSIITGVARDHTAWLGETVGAIAREKAGILRAGVPALTAAAGDALHVIRRVATRRSVPLAVVRAVDQPRVPAPPDTYEVGDVEVSLAGTRFTLAGPWERPRTLRCSLLGPHQALNAGLAAAAAFTLADRGCLPRIGPAAVQAGLQGVRWPGRLELVRCEPPVLIDGAHNPDGMQALRRALAALFPGRVPVLVCGMLADKDAEACARCWAGRPLPVFTVPVPNPRGTDPVELAARFRRAGLAWVWPVPSWQEGVWRALTLLRRGEAGLVCVCGSLYLVSQLRPALDDLIDAHGPWG